MRISIWCAQACVDYSSPHSFVAATKSLFVTILLAFNTHIAPDKERKTSQALCSYPYRNSILDTTTSCRQPSLTSYFAKNWSASLEALLATSTVLQILKKGSEAFGREFMSGYPAPLSKPSSLRAHQYGKLGIYLYVKHAPGFAAKASGAQRSFLGSS
jgi:hypothetical protein